MTARLAQVSGRQRRRDAAVGALRRRRPELRRHEAGDGGGQGPSQQGHDKDIGYELTVQGQVWDVFGALGDGGRNGVGMKQAVEEAKIRHGGVMGQASKLQGQVVDLGWPCGDGGRNRGLRWSR